MTGTIGGDESTSDGSELRNDGLTSLIWVVFGYWYMRICLCIVVIDYAMLFV